MAVRIFAKYRCVTCEGAPPLVPDEGQSHEDHAADHLTANIGHEVVLVMTSEAVIEE